MKKAILLFVNGTLFKIIRIYGKIMDWILLSIYVPYLNRGWRSVPVGDQAQWLQEQPFYRFSRRSTRILCLQVVKITMYLWVTLGYVSKA